MNYLLSGIEEITKVTIGGPVTEEQNIKKQIFEVHPEYTAEQIEKAYQNYLNRLTIEDSRINVRVDKLPAAEKKALASVFEPKTLVPLLVAGAGAYLLFS